MLYQCCQSPHSVYSLSFPLNSDNQLHTSTCSGENLFEFIYTPRRVINLPVAFGRLLLVRTIPDSRVKGSNVLKSFRESQFQYFLIIQTKIKNKNQSLLEPWRRTHFDSSSLCAGEQLPPLPAEGVSLFEQPVGVL